MFHSPTAISHLSSQVRAGTCSKRVYKILVGITMLYLFLFFFYSWTLTHSYPHSCKWESFIGKKYWKKQWNNKCYTSLKSIYTVGALPERRPTYWEREEHQTSCSDTGRASGWAKTWSTTDRKIPSKGHRNDPGRPGIRKTLSPYLPEHPTSQKVSVCLREMMQKRQWLH